MSAMLITLLRRLVHRPLARQSDITPWSSCPTTLSAGTDPLWKRMALRMRPRTPLDGHAFLRVAQVRQEFLESLADIGRPAAGELLDRIARARSLLELWHLRPEVFNLVS